MFYFTSIDLSILSLSSIIKGYRVTSATTTDYGLELVLALAEGGNVYGTDITPIHVSVYMETQDRLRVKIFDPNYKRWEVPEVVKVPTPTTKPPIMDYKFTYTVFPFGFAVVRVSDGQAIFNSTSPASYVLYLCVRV